MSSLRRLLGPLLLPRPRPAEAAPPVDEAWARQVLAQARHFYIAIDEDGAVLAWNRAAAQLFGWTEREAVGRLLDDLIVPGHSAAAHRAGVEHFKRTGHGRGIDGAIEVQALRRDGTTVPVELSIWAQRTAEGWRFHALGHDLSERKAAEQLLQVLAEHRQGLLESTSPDEVRRRLCDTTRQLAGCEGAFLYELDGRPAPGSGLELRLTRESRTGSGPAPAVVQLSAEQRALVERGSVWIADVHELPAEELDALRATGLRSFSIEPLRQDGALIGVLALGWPAPRDEPAVADPRLLTLLTTEAAMVAGRLVLQQQLEHAARYDALTGVLNRRALGEELEHELRRAARDERPLSLVMLDLDAFKAYNDAHGHPAGDELLVAVTRAWTAELRDQDRLGRVGGDEFVVLLPGADEAAADATVARLVGASAGIVGVTAGVAEHRPGETVAALVRRSDEALYVRKRQRPGGSGTAAG